MIKPLSAIATAVAMFAALVTTAAPAVAAGPCSIVVPRTVSIDRHYKLIPAILGSDCAASDVSYASWDVRLVDYGPSNMFIFDGASSDTIAFYAWEGNGTYLVEPSSAWDSSSVDLAQNTSSMVLKYATWAYVASSRAGRAVYINALIKNYSENDLVRGGGRSVYLQRYLNGTWQTMLMRTANSTGQFTVGFIQPKVYQYRLIVSETSSAWGGRSGSTFR